MHGRSWWVTNKRTLSCFVALVSGDKKIISSIIYVPSNIFLDAFEFVGKGVCFNKSRLKEGLSPYWYKMGNEAKGSWTHWFNGEVQRYSCKSIFIFLFFRILTDIRQRERDYIYMLLCAFMPWIACLKHGDALIVPDILHSLVFHCLYCMFYRAQTKYQIVLTKTDVVFPIDVARRAMQIEEVNMAQVQ